MQLQDASGERKPAGPRIGSTLPTVIALIADTFLLVRRVCWPPLDLLFRFWLAQQFFVSGLIKVTHWETALDLAAHEYPVSWMSPTAAAYTGAAIEVIAPIFLATGLLTRYAAFALLALSLVIQFSYQPFDSQLFWIALFGWYAVNRCGTDVVGSTVAPGPRRQRAALGAAHHPDIGGRARASQSHVPVLRPHLVGSCAAGRCVPPRGSWCVVTRRDAVGVGAVGRGHRRRVHGARIGRLAGSP